MMNKKLMVYVFIFLFSVFISAVSQIMLKKSAQKTYETRLKEYLNPLVIFAYAIFFLSSLVTMMAYKVVPLSMGPILEASGYVFVSVLGYIFLKERISKRKLLGMGVIIGGIILFTIGSNF